MVHIKEDSWRGPGTGSTVPGISVGQEPVLFIAGLLIHSANICWEPPMSQGAENIAVILLWPGVLCPSWEQGLRAHHSGAAREVEHILPEFKTKIACAHPCICYCPVYGKPEAYGMSRLHSEVFKNV